MIQKIFSFAFAILVLTTAPTCSELNLKTVAELNRSDMFPPEDGKPRPLVGTIQGSRYYCPQNVFSCQAYDFDQGQYWCQDVLFDDMYACVAFYSTIGNFKKAEIIFFPGIEKKNLDLKEFFKDTFNHFGIGILEDVDNAQGIEILNEEMIEDNMLFIVISIEKMSVLRDRYGNYMSSTRGFLIFRNTDRVVLLSNQEVTLSGRIHTPRNHIEKLQKEILEFSRTFTFGPIPTIKKEKTAALEKS